MAPTNGPAKSSMIPPRMENLPMAQAGADEIKLVSHSNVVYWWPSWVVGYLMAFITYVQGRAVTIEPGLVAYIHPSNNPGLLSLLQNAERRIGCGWSATVGGAPCRCLL